MALPQKTPIAIIGASIAGPILALQLLTQPLLSALYSPTIYERAPSTTSGAAVALTSNALFVLYELGLRDELDAISCETEKISIWRSADGGKGGEGNGKFLNSIKSPNWAEDLGTSLRVVERGALVRLLVSEVRERGGEVVFGKRVVGVHRGVDGVKVRFEGGGEVDAGLVVGADGAWSEVRRAIIKELEGGDEDAAKDEKIEQRWKPEFGGPDVVYGISRSERDSGQEEVRNEQREAENEQGDTHWVFLDGGIASTWALPQGKVFWTLTCLFKTPPERSDRAKAGEHSLYGAPVSLGGYALEDTKDFLAKYEKVWHPTAGELGNLFRNSERIVRTPLWYRAWEAEEIAAENVVLIGDAARLMLPTSGQGACFAIEDATVFANALVNNPPSSQNGKLDFSRAIEEYVQARLPRSKSMTKQSYWTGVLMSWLDSWWLRWLVDLSTAWLPTGGDPKLKKGKKKGDPMGWIYDERYTVELRDDGEGSVVR